MNNQTITISQNQAARVAGLMCPIIFLLAPFAEFFVREGLIPSLADVLAVVVVVTALVGELPLTLWLLIKG